MMIKKETTQYTIDAIILKFYDHVTKTLDRVSVTIQMIPIIYISATEDDTLENKQMIRSKLKESLSDILISVTKLKNECEKSLECLELDG